VTDESVFAQALAIGSPAERAAYLDRACAGNPALRAEVQALLDAHAASNPLDEPPADVARTGAYEPAPVADEAVGTTLAGKYKLVELIGAGGMGAVYMAQQTEPVKRLVAVKVIRDGMDTRQVLARCEAERQALALMDHPNIAKVLDAGTTDRGRPFFVMELVKGVPITEFCDARKLSPRERLELFVPVCQAIQHAHQKGVIHRDIKPSNVLVALYDGKPVPKVIDFGVAKAAGQPLTDMTLVTGFGAIVGTPEYMSPEQAELNQLDIDTRSDVFALGVLLYELLTGTTPLNRSQLGRAALLEVLRIVREVEPPKPSTRVSTSDARASIAANRNTDPVKLSKLMRGELDWIVMKALEKDRNRRYESATALAKDVERHLRGDAVEACPPTLGYRLRKAYKRNRTAVWVASAVACAVAVAAIGFVEASLRTRQARFAEASRVEAEAARDLAAARSAEAEAAREALARVEYARTVDLAYREFHTNRLERAKELHGACAERFRGWEWRYLARLFHPEDVCLTHPSGVRAAALSPDGARVATGSDDGAVRVWDSSTGRLLRTIEAKEDGWAGSVRFTPDGTGLLTTHYTSARLWSLADGRELLKLAHTDSVYSADISPDAARIVTCCQDRKARVWDAKTGHLLVTVDRYARLYGPIRFDPSGKEVLTLNGDALHVWDARSGAERLAVPQRDYPRTARFSPDGARIACAGSDHWVRVFDTATGQLLKTLKVDSGEIEDLAFTPDGTRLALAGRERVAREWDIDSARELRALSNHTGPVTAVAYTRDGHRLLTASGDRTARVWHRDRMPGSEIFRPVIGLLALAVSPDGRYVAVGGREGEVQLWDLSPAGALKGARVWVGEHGRQFVRSVAFSPDGKRLATASEDGSVRVWDATTGARLVENGEFRSGLQCVAFHPARDELACSALDGGVHVLDGRTGRAHRKLAHPADPVYAVAYTPDGRYLLTGGWDGKVRAWDAGSWEWTRTLDGDQLVRGLSVSADGGRVAVRYQGGKVLVWDFATGRVLRALPCPREDAISVALSPDGNRVATSGQGEVHIWDVGSGTELLSPVFR
jgi:WD40 repeat protein/serine/threonine protein kinase